MMRHEGGLNQKPNPSWLFIIALCCLAYIALTMSGCASIPPGQDVTKANYPNLRVEVNGADYYGIGVIPKADEYNMVIKPNDRATRLMIRGCHITYIKDKPDSSWFKRGIEYKYVIAKGLADKQTCQLHIATIDHKEKTLDFAILDHVDARPHVSMSPLRVQCNGEDIESALGAIACRAAAGTFQAIHLPYKSIVTSWDREGKPSQFCEQAMETHDGFNYEITMAPHKCIYFFTSNQKAANGKWTQARLTTFGVTDYPYRED